MLVLPEECGGGFFWETTSGFIPVFSAVWFDSGYMCLSVYGGVGLLVAMHLALCSFVVFRPWCAASWPVWISRSSLCTGLAWFVQVSWFPVCMEDDFMFYPYSELSLVRQRIHAVRQSMERKNFVFFYMKRWITDPEIDSRSRNTFYCPLYLTVTCSLRRLRST